MGICYCNVDGQSVAKQRLGKQTSTIEKVFSMGSVPRPLLCNGSVNVSTIEAVFSVVSVQRSYLKNKRRYDSVHLAFKIPYVYDYITKLCRREAKVILNHENPNVRAIGQGEPRHRKYKRLKLGGGQAYDRSSV
jgi:hypothetical protein